jgi:hypothetical protein
MKKEKGNGRTTFLPFGFLLFPYLITTDLVLAMPG